MQNKVVVIVGPTGSGKTDKAIELAKTGNYEVINGDSMQVYKELSIGNNKGDLSEFGEIPVWLFDVISVTEEFSVADYQARARKVIAEIHARANVPIIVGGSGYYIHAALFDYNFAEQNKMELSDDVAELQQKLEELNFDLDQLNNSDRNNPRRLQNYIRKLAAGELSTSETQRPLYELDVNIIDVNLEELRPKLEKRVEEMFAQGLIAEVENLVALDKVDEVSQQVKNAAGYNQVFNYLHQGKKISLEELQQQIVTSHYQLAKKQITWNRKYFAD